MEDADDQIEVARATIDAVTPLFQCAQCSRRFTRGDHLARHIRTHTREKPHRCLTCGKPFARADLLRRHSLRHVDPAHRASQVTGTGARPRTAKACRACASSKLKCEDQRPCQRCVRRGLLCDDLSDVTLQPPSSTPQPADTVGLDSQITAMQGAPDGNDQAMAFSATTAPRDSHQVVDDGPDLRMQQDAMTTGGDFQQPNGGADNFADPLDFGDNGVEPYTDFLRGWLFSGPPSPTNGTPRPPRMSNTARFDLWGQDFDASCWDPERALINVPFEDIPPIPPSDLLDFGLFNEQGMTAGSSPEQAVHAAASEAFTTSVWHWLPEITDHQKAGQQDLALLADTSSKPDDALTLAPEVLSKRLTPADRDRVLSLLLAHCERAVVVRVASSFPSHQLMQRLVHTALHFQTIGTLPWLHVPTFAPQLVKDELLSAIIAYGASLSPVPAHQNLGGAITDILLSHVPERWGKNNAATRDLQLWQCWATLLHHMFWSGSKRKTEIGESHAQPLLTMLRRSGAFARAYYWHAPPTAEDTPAELEAKWRAWAEQESRIRLVHHLFIHDAQISMTRFVNPLLSAAELTLPLPANDRLWSATSAEQWRSVYLRSMSHLGLLSSLADCVRDVLTQPPQNPVDPNDTHHAATRAILSLYGMWHLIWDCQLLSSWLRTDGLRYDQGEILPDARIATLSRVLGSFQAVSDQVADSSQDAKRTETWLIQNYLQLALKAPIRSLAVFAGSEGENEAQAVLPMLQEWTQGREGRQSLWYAGQIFRATRLLPRSLMRGFFAVTVYHASLTLWAFGIIQSARQSTLGLNATPWSTLGDHSSHTFNLDGASTSHLQNFVSLGNKLPVLSNVLGSGTAHSETVVVLHSPSAVMQVGIGILKDRAQVRENRVPKFVESILQLMEGLSKAARSVGLG